MIALTTDTVKTKAWNVSGGPMVTGNVCVSNEHRITVPALFLYSGRTPKWLFLTHRCWSAHCCISPLGDFCQEHFVSICFGDVSAAHDVADDHLLLMAGGHCKVDLTGQLLAGTGRGETRGYRLSARR